MHVLCCKEDGFVTSRNNEVKDIVVTFLLEVSKDVKVDLMKLKGEEQQLNAKKKTQDDVRLDIVEEYSGSGVKQHFWMSGCSMTTLKVTWDRPSNNATQSTKMKKDITRIK